MPLFAPAKSAKIYKTEEGADVYGVIAEFDTPADLYHACEAVRDAGYRRWDAYCPFPVHGLDEAMGLRRTNLGLLCGVIGIASAGLAYLLQWGVSHVLYPMVVQGKPTNAWEAYVPITFELGILLTAFAALFGMLALNGLPMWYHPLLKKSRFLRVSDDRYVICIETTDPKFDPEATRDLLAAAGGKHVDLVEA